MDVYNMTSQLASEQGRHSIDYVHTSVETHAGYDPHAYGYDNAAYSHDWSHMVCCPNAQNNDYEIDFDSLAMYERVADLRNVDGHE